MSKFIVSILAMSILSACTVGPNYKPEEAGLPEGLQASFHAEHESGDVLSAQQHFWQGFEDPLLEQLVYQALQTNRTLMDGLARYEQANALLGGARRSQLPSVTTTATASETRPSNLERAATGAPASVETYQAGIVASWELDLFGRLRRIREAHAAELEAAGADLEAMRIAMVGDLASSYFRLRGLQAQYDVANQNVALYETSLGIISASVDAGRGTDFDRLRARAQHEQSRAALPSLRAAIRVEMHRIAVLTGQQPGALVEILSEPQSLPLTVPVIPVDSPGELLRRRPDVLAAEQRLAAATARIGVATADLFPRFTLGGLIGSSASSTSDLFSAPAEYRSAALGVDWAFLDHGQVRARIEAADAQSRASLAGYQQTILNALEEVENRIVQYSQIQQQLQLLVQAEALAHQATTLARTRHENGLIAYFEVLNAEQELAAAREAAAQSRTAQVVAMVDLYRALAGPPDTVSFAQL